MEFDLSTMYQYFDGCYVERKRYVEFGEKRFSQD